MLLSDLTIHGKNEKHSIATDGKIISSIHPSDRSEKIKDNEIRFENAIAFPGLINSHDHLELNLFPRLGNRVYKNYVEWGEDIHVQNTQIISDINAVPASLRIQWGIYKNLLNGFTMVVNHGKRISSDSELIHVFQDCLSLHSVAGEKNWKLAINKPRPKQYPIVMHIGEGTDMRSHEEINRLIKWNILNRKIVAVHGVAMDEEQAKHFKALVWCPASNRFLLDATAAIDQLREHVEIVFGTDSTLTAPWNAWEHFRIARDQQLVTPEEIFHMLTKSPASCWNLRGKGELEQGYCADIVVANKTGVDFIDSFFQMNPENILLVMHDGIPRMFDHSISPQLQSQLAISDYSECSINGVTKYVQGDVPALIENIRKCYTGAQFPVSAPITAQEIK